MTITAEKQLRFEKYITDLNQRSFPKKTRQWVIAYVVETQGLTADKF